MVNRSLTPVVRRNRLQYLRIYWKQRTGDVASSDARLLRVAMPLAGDAPGERGFDKATKCWLCDGNRLAVKGTAVEARKGDGHTEK